MRFCFQFIALIVLVAIANSTGSAAAANQNIAGHNSGTVVKSAKSNLQKAKKKIHLVARHALVPPPPAYMPSILPELYMRNTNIVAEAATEDDSENSPPVNPYAKYVYNRHEEAPKPVQSRNGVSVWRPSASTGSNSIRSY